jgi:signal transduction histidine kinase/ligand-binding sensor domain-containing protein
VRHFGVKEGLPHRRVSQLAADPQGYLWLATPAGLVRWDGYVFVNHTRANGLARDGADQVACDGDGFLWVLHEEGGLDILDPRTGKARPAQEHFAGKGFSIGEAPVTGLAAANDGTIVIVQAGRLVRYRNAKGGFQFTPLLCGTNLFPYKVEVAGDVWCICSEGRRGWNKGELIHVSSWTAGANGPAPKVERVAGIYNVFHAGHDLLDTVPRPTNGVDVLLERVSARVTPSLEVVPRNDAFVLPQQRLALEAGMVRLPLTKELCLVNTLLMRMQEGDDPQHAEVLFDIANVMPQARFKTYDALRDRRGNLWLGTEFGLYQVSIGVDRFQRWLHRDPSAGVVGTSVRGMAVQGGRLLVNTENRGFIQLDPRDGRTLTKDTVVVQGLGLFAGEDGTIWLGRADRLEQRTREGAVQTFDLVPPIMDIWSMFPLPNGRLMVGSGAGFAVIETDVQARRKIQQVAHPDHPALDRAVVYQFHRDRNGGILASTSAGLYELDETGAVRRSPAELAGTKGKHMAQLLMNDIRHVHADSAGILWLATATQGLVRWDRGTGQVRVLSTREGFPPGSIHATYADARGDLWLPTDNGLVRYDPVSGQVHVYTTADGLAHDEFNRISHAQGPNGRIYFGSLNGITVFDPSEMMGSEAAIVAPLVFEAVKVQPEGMSDPVELTRDVAAGSGITLRPSDRYFTVALRLLSFQDPAFIRYAWRIDGIDEDWNIQREPELRFNALPYGEHELRMRAIDADGHWSATELAVPIHVVRPLLLRWWSITLIALLLIAAVVAFVRYRERRLREVIQVRDRIALDLHDEVGSTLSSIVLFSTAVTRTTHGLPDKANSLLQRIKDNSTKAMESMNDIVWSVDPEHDELSDVVARMRAFAQPLCETRDIELKVDIPPGLLTRKLGMTGRKNLYLVFKEALNNAVKHAHCDRINVTMREEGDDLVLRVTDNGRGMAASNGEAAMGGNGLDNMRKRASELKGAALCRAVPGGGTEVLLRFPARADQ